MPDKTYILRFKSPEPFIRAIVASTAGIYGDRLILLNSEGLLAALFVSETVESWNEYEIEVRTDYHPVLLS